MKIDRPPRSKYAAMPPGKKFELIEGIVYMSSPVTDEHGSPHIDIATWIGVYKAATPGLAASADGTVLYLNGGDDLQVSLNRVEGAGGHVLIPKTLISPEVGYFAQFLDTEGNRVGLYSMK